MGLGESQEVVEGEVLDVGFMLSIELVVRLSVVIAASVGAAQRRSDLEAIAYISCVKFFLYYIIFCCV